MSGQPGPALPSYTVSVLAFHSLASIEICVRSVLDQDYGGSVDLWVREQGGDDEEWEVLRRIAADASATGRPMFLERGHNLGFAAGHNRAIRASQADLFFPLNADAVLAPGFLTAAAVPFREGGIAAVQGKLLRWDGDRPARGPSGRPVIDTTGLIALRSRRFVNRGEGEEDSGQYDRADAPFAPDGAAAVFLRQALDDVAIPRSVFGEGEGEEYFDEAFFAYKEDVDLGWRLRLRGWEPAFCPTAVAWHGRGAPDLASIGLRLLRHRLRPSVARRLGFANQRLMQVKNDGRQDLRHDAWPWLGREVLAWVAALLTPRRFVGSVATLVRGLKVARRKRAWIQSRRTVARAHWFS